ncbi:cyclic nucleotide-binding domain-containing protein [Devosia sp. PTR5]|uniref:Cyclic nucleotide-binding domain-containing protein n=1 Tax=Devosia oryzisoli TaxID=2774138 RepID=A0A927IU97_9HYPH|nr:cyclic nucleotide-binding domain-containing protein [Devosia oryzisoli]MBD8066496.1 cyclic nucleotide-binding domain-containing protein [Devosia oryzisoli]
MHDAAAILAKADFFEMCGDTQRELLGFASDRRHFSAGATIYKAGEDPQGAHVLVEGSLRATHEGVDAVEPYTVSAPGSVIGLMALILSKPRPVTFTAISDCDTLFVPRAAFLKLLRQDDDLAQQAIDRIESDLREYLGALQPLRRKM